MPPLTRLGAGWHARPLLARSRVELAELGAPARSRLGRGCNERGRASRSQLSAPPGAAAGARALAGRARLRSRAAPATRHRRSACSSSSARADRARCADGAALSVTALRALGSERRANALRVWIDAQDLPLPDARRLAELAGPLLAARADANPAGRLGGRGRAPPCRSACDRATQRGDRRRAQLLWSWRSRARTCAAARAWPTCARSAMSHGPIDLARLPQQLDRALALGRRAAAPRAGGPQAYLEERCCRRRVSRRPSAPVCRCSSRACDLLPSPIAGAMRRIQPQRHSHARARIVWRRA